MADPNPYQPPQMPEPLTQVQLALRGVGCGVILLLTPIATFVAFFIGCTTAFAADRAINSLPAAIEGIAVYGLLFGLPGVTLAGMSWWGIQTYRRQSATTKTGPNRPDWLRNE